MVTKQVKEQAVTVEQSAPVQNPQKNLFFTVTTFDAKGEVVAKPRVVDLYHYGTRNWLQNHIWWAMHNDHMVSTMLASDKEIEEFMASSKEQLAQKFNKAA